jgi:chromosome segregation ATPase
MIDIQNWLTSQMDFAEGCALLKQHCKNKLLVNAICSSTRNAAKLQYELKKLAGIPLEAIFNQKGTNAELIKSIPKENVRKGEGAKGRKPKAEGKKPKKTTNPPTIQSLAQEDIENLKKELEELKQELQDREDASDRIDDVESDVSDLQDRIEKLEETIKKKTESDDPIAQAKEYLKSLYIEIDKMHKQLHDLGDSNTPAIIKKRAKILKKRIPIIKLAAELYQLKEQYFKTNIIDDRLLQILSKRPKRKNH